MARAPAALAASPAAGATGGMGADPLAAGGAGAAGADPGTGDTDTDTGGDVVVTICKSGDGSYMVYAGDEPDDGSGGGGADMSADDADTMGAAGDAAAGGAAGGMGGGMAAPEGQPADSIGAALKIAMDILNSDKSSEGAPGNADDQLAAGFAGSQSPTPATGAMKQKY
jgi:hypothetical protein